MELDEPVEPVDPELLEAPVGPGEEDDAAPAPEGSAPGGVLLGGMELLLELLGLP